MLSRDEVAVKWRWRGSIELMVYLDLMQVLCQRTGIWGMIQLSVGKERRNMLMVRHVTP